MVRKSCFILGIGLAILWWVGLSENQSATVLWFDAVAAVLSFGMAALVEEPERSPSRAAGPGGPGRWAGGGVDRWDGRPPADLGQLAQLRVCGGFHGRRHVGGAGNALGAQRRPPSPRA